MNTPTPPETRKSVIVYGPQGCGKTLHARALARHFGLAHWTDLEYAAGDYRRAAVMNHLLLTCTPVPRNWRRAIHFDTAMKLMAAGRPLTDDVFDQDAPNIPWDAAWPLTETHPRPRRMPYTHSHTGGTNAA